MFIFSNTYFFPVLQATLFAIFLFALMVDAPWRKQSNLTRAEESMVWIERVTGITVAGGLTVLDKTVFDADPALARSSAFVISIDVVAVVYVCFFSAWGRSKLIGIYARRKEERR